MKTLVLFSLILFVSAVFSVGVFGQKKADALTVSLGDLQKKSDFPGFAAAIVDENGALYEKGFGYADLKKKTAFTAETIQPIGSVSKTVIGVALLKAVELKLFTLETKVNDVLPFKIYNPKHPKIEIKIVDLAVHTSGIVDREEIYEKTYLRMKTPNVALGVFLKNYLAANGNYYSVKNFGEQPAGAEYNYTNIGAALAAYLVEVKSGLTFAEFTAKHVFEPLKMNRTNWFYDMPQSRFYATLYDAKRKPLPVYSSITYPDGSLRTSLADLSVFLSEIIRGYDGRGKILSNDSFQTLLEQKFTAENMPLSFDPKEPNRGIFFAHRRDGKIGHTGSDYGVSAFMFFDPATKIGKIFITNADVAENPKLAAQFAEIWRVMEKYETTIRRN